MGCGSFMQRLGRSLGARRYRCAGCDIEVDKVDAEPNSRCAFVSCLTVLTQDTNASLCMIKMVFHLLTFGTRPEAFQRPAATTMPYHNFVASFAPYVFVIFGECSDVGHSVDAFCRFSSESIDDESVPVNGHQCNASCYERFESLATSQGQKTAHKKVPESLGGDNSLWWTCR